MLPVRVRDVAQALPPRSRPQIRCPYSYSINAVLLYVCHECNAPTHFHARTFTLSLSCRWQVRWLTHAYTRTRMHARTRTRAHTFTHTGHAMAKSTSLPVRSKSGLEGGPLAAASPVSPLAAASPASPVNAHSDPASATVKRYDRPPLLGRYDSPPIFDIFDI